MAKQQDCDREHLPPAYSTNITSTPGLPVLPVEETISEDIRKMLDATRELKKVFLIDDSGSMQTRVIIPQQSGPSIITTRWEELQSSLLTAFKLIKDLCNDGIDIYFLNRIPLLNVTNIEQIHSIFTTKPSGSTPLFKTLRAIYDKYKDYSVNISITIWTDGLPNPDDVINAHNVFKLFYPKNKTTKFGICIILCTDEENVLILYKKYDKKYPLNVLDDYKTEMDNIHKIQKELISINQETYFALVFITPWCPELDSLNEKQISKAKLRLIADKFIYKYEHHVSYVKPHTSWLRRIFVRN